MCLVQTLNLITYVQFVLIAGFYFHCEFNHLTASNALPNILPTAEAINAATLVK